MSDGKKILVVEDNPDFLGVICAFLSNHYSDIRSAETIAQAAGIMHEWHPDVVIADFHLPDAKATALLEVPPTDLAGRFLIMTGDIGQSEKLKKKSGIDYVLFKPFRFSDLLAAIGTDKGKTS